MNACIQPWTPEVYFRQSEFVSRSNLHRLSDSIAVFLYGEPSTQRFRGESLSNKPAALGNLVHRGVLEPGLYAGAVVPYAKTQRAARGESADSADTDDLSFADDDRDPPDDYCAMLSPRVAKSVARDLGPVDKKVAAAEKKAAAAKKKAVAAAKKAAKAEQEAAKAELLAMADEHDLWLVPPNDIDRADAIIASIWSNEKASVYLRGEKVLGGHECMAIYSEVAITWTRCGVPCRALLDRVLIYPHCVVVVDLKTDRGTPSPRRWADRAIDEWLYEQADFYCSGAAEAWDRPALFLWVVARNNPPFECGIQRPRARELDAAAQINDAMLARLAKLMEKDEWVDEWTTRVVEAIPSRRGRAILEARIAEAVAMYTAE